LKQSKDLIGTEDVEQSMQACGQSTKKKLQYFALVHCHTPAAAAVGHLDWLGAKLVVDVLHLVCC
jgi:hypothetical protein